MADLLPLTEALTQAAQYSSPEEVLAKSDSFLQRAADLSGISLEELREMNNDGSLDRFMSERFYLLSLVAINATLEAIESGQIPAESLYRIATESSKIAQKLVGRDIQKKFVVSADLWERAAADVEVLDAN